MQVSKKRWLLWNLCCRPEFSEDARGASRTLFGACRTDQRPALRPAPAANLQEVVVVSTAIAWRSMPCQRASGRAKVGLSIRRQPGFFECGSVDRGSRFPSLRPPKRGRVHHLFRVASSLIHWWLAKRRSWARSEGVSASSGQRNTGKILNRLFKSPVRLRRGAQPTGIGRSSTSVGAVALMGRKDFRRRFHPADRPDHRRGKNG